MVHREQLGDPVAHMVHRLFHAVIQFRLVRRLLLFPDAQYALERPHHGERGFQIVHQVLHFPEGTVLHLAGVRFHPHTGVGFAQGGDLPQPVFVADQHEQHQRDQGQRDKADQRQHVDLRLDPEDLGRSFDIAGKLPSADRQKGSGRHDIQELYGHQGGHDKQRPLEQRNVIVVQQIVQYDDGRHQEGGQAEIVMDLIDGFNDPVGDKQDDQDQRRVGEDDPPLPPRQADGVDRPVHADIMRDRPQDIHGHQQGRGGDQMDAFLRQRKAVIFQDGKDVFVEDPRHHGSQQNQKSPADELREFLHLQTEFRFFLRLRHGSVRFLSVWPGLLSPLRLLRSRRRPPFHTSGRLPPCPR